MSEYEPRFLQDKYDAGRFTKRGEIENAISATQIMDNIVAQKATRTEEQTKIAAVAERAVKTPNLTCFISEFPLAMAAISNIHDYARGPLVKGDYLPSLLRHLFEIGDHDDHLAAVAWNAIAQLELRLRNERIGE